MTKRLITLLVVILTLICSVCVFTACSGSVPPGDTGGIETPSGPEEPGDEPGTEPEEPGGSSGGGSGFEGNPPSNPNKEDSYDAN